MALDAAIHLLFFALYWYQKCSHVLAVLMHFLTVFNYYTIHDLITSISHYAIKVVMKKDMISVLSRSHKLIKTNIKNHNTISFSLAQKW